MKGWERHNSACTPPDHQALTLSFLTDQELDVSVGDRGCPNGFPDVCVSNMQGHYLQGMRRTFGIQLVGEDAIRLWHLGPSPHFPDSKLIPPVPVALRDVKPRVPSFGERGRETEGDVGVLSTHTPVFSHKKWGQR